MSKVSFVALPMTCPKCQHQGYMKRLIGKSIGEMNVKCLNCNSYFSLDELEQPASTPDFVEVVRCIDCCHHEDEEPNMVYCPNIVGGWVDNNFYCADGNRGEK